MGKKARVNGIEISYSIRGSGHPLVLIGGYTMVKESWEAQAEALSKHFMLLTFDNRGVGDSTVPAGPFTISDMASDTVALMDALGIDSAHIFGVSMGGLIAQLIAIEHPERVIKVALGCTTHGGRHAVQPERDVMAILEKAADTSIPAEEAIRIRLPVLFSERFIRQEPEKVERFIRFSLRHLPSPEGAAGQFRALSVFNVRRRLGEIRSPVLVITGTEDRMMPPENSRLLAERIAGARLYMVEGAGHLFFLERPDEVNEVLKRFFL